MSSTKTDRTYARTAQDIERKYAFGKTFSDMLGLINDNRDHVDSTESSLRKTIVEQSTTIKRDAEQIVMQASEDLTTIIDGVAADIYKAVESKVDADGFLITVEDKIASGVDRVETKSGYVFDSSGLSISRQGDEMTNLLDNTGMYVKKNDEDILVANKDGVQATDLHAKTYLIIGTGNGRSRFEDCRVDGDARTACFWIGG